MEGFGYGPVCVCVCVYKGKLHVLNVPTWETREALGYVGELVGKSVEGRSERSICVRLNLLSSFITVNLWELNLISKLLGTGQTVWMGLFNSLDRCGTQIPTTRYKWLITHEANLLASLYYYTHYAEIRCSHFFLSPCSSSWFFLVFLPTFGHSLSPSWGN